jgi:AcrR family transcriptional regulator
MPGEPASTGARSSEPCIAGNPTTIVEIMTETVDSSPAKRAGRKRDSSVERRILHAALDVFTTAGWRGFSFDGVARAAGVGKSTIYLRYETRQDLLLAVLAEYGYQGAGKLADHGSLEADLVEFAQNYAEWLDGPAGHLSIRLAVESRLNPDVAEVLRPRSASLIGQAHGIVHRAKRRGEIPAGVSTAVLLDALVGGLINRTITSPDRPAYASAAGRRFVSELVRNVMYGVVPRPK